jgi:succinate dehydrogenase hydrophobic anchor subunit
MNFYEILGVSQNATEDEIKSAFRELAVQKHPDKGGSNEEFIQLKTAYDTLKNPLLRKDYDLKLKPESIDNTYNTQHDFNTDESPETAPPQPAEPARPLDEDYIIDQLSKIARDIRRKSILNTIGGFFLGLSGIILTILTLGFVVFSGLTNSGFGMVKRDLWQIINPYTSLFGVLTRSNIYPTEKITNYIKSKRQKSLLKLLITAILLSTISILTFTAIKQMD